MNNDDYEAIQALRAGIREKILEIAKLKEEIAKLKELRQPAYVRRNFIPVRRIPDAIW